LVSLTDIPVKGVAAPEAPLDGPVHADKDKTMLAEEDKMNNTLAEADKMNKTLHADEDETMPHAPELVGREAPLDGPELAAPPSSQGRKGRERRRSTAGADEPVAAAPTEPVDAVLEPADDAAAAPEPVPETVDPVAAPKVAAPKGRKRRRSTAASPQHGVDEPVAAAPTEPVDAVLKPADDAVAAPEPVPETVDPVAAPVAENRQGHELSRHSAGPAAAAAAAAAAADVAAPKGRKWRRSTAASTQHGADEPVAAAPTEPVDAVLEPADDAVAAPIDAPSSRSIEGRGFCDIKLSYATMTRPENRTPGEPVDPVAAPKVAAPRGRKRRRSTAASPQHGADEPVVAAPAEPVDAVLKPADDAVAAPEPVPETVDPVAGDGPDHGPGVPAPEDGGDNFDHDGGNAMLADTLADTPADTLGDAADTPLSLASMLEVLEQAKNSPSLKTHAGLGFRV
jgi:hypothetical protein